MEKKLLFQFRQDYRHLARVVDIALARPDFGGERLEPFPNCPATHTPALCKLARCHGSDIFFGHFTGFLQSYNNVRTFQGL